mgnify:CR=1 FL=1
MMTTGAEFKAFYTDPEWWPQGAYHDDVVLNIDGIAYGEDAGLLGWLNELCEEGAMQGETPLAPDSKVMIEPSGFVWLPEIGYRLLAEHFRLWRKHRKRMQEGVLTVRVASENLEVAHLAVQQALERQGIAAEVSGASSAIAEQE